MARTLFAQRGYEGTSIDAVLTEAGVSRGALYHHFDGKDALFEAVLEALETDIGQQVLAAAAGQPTSADALRAGSVAWVRLAGDPVVQRVLLIDAPSVLGWEKWRAVEERHALGLIRAVLQEIADEGGLQSSMVDIFAHVVLATINEIALVVARADDQEAVMVAATQAIEEVLARLLPPGTSEQSG